MQGCDAIALKRSLQGKVSLRGSAAIVLHGIDLDENLRPLREQPAFQPGRRGAVRSPGLALP